MHRGKKFLASLWAGLDGSLQARILVPTAILFAFTLTVMVFAAVQLHSSDMEEAVRERGELFAHMVADGVSAAMLHDGPSEIPEVLALVSGHRNDIESVSLLGPGGDIAFSSKPSLVGTRPWKVWPPGETAVVPPDAPSQFAVLRPLVNMPSCAGCHGPESKAVGWLDVRFSRRALLAIKDHLAQTLALTAVPSLFLLLAIAWWLLGREAIGPLHRLVNAMRRAQAGEQGVRADEGRPDELGVAARGFDATLAALRGSQAALEAVHREQMLRADRFAAVGELASGLAHEIKNPLAGLSGALELLAEDLAGSRHSEVVSEMRHQVDRLAKIMESLLSFARPPRPRMQHTDLNATLDKVLFLVLQQRRSSFVKVQRELDTSLPPVVADPGQLEQVFLNICLNALQSMNGAEGTLSVRTFSKGDRAVVEVGDTGPGIPLEVRAHVFKPFFTTRRNGTGLGLAISERIVAEHGGQIGFTCPPEGGTLFAVALPAAPAAREQAV